MGMLTWAFSWKWRAVPQYLPWTALHPESPACVCVNVGFILQAKKLIYTCIILCCKRRRSPGCQYSQNCLKWSHIWGKIIVTSRKMQKNHWSLQKCTHKTKKDFTKFLCMLYFFKVVNEINYKNVGKYKCGKKKFWWNWLKYICWCMKTTVVMLTGCHGGQICLRWWRCQRRTLLAETEKNTKLYLAAQTSFLFQCLLGPQEAASVDLGRPCTLCSRSPPPGGCRWSTCGEGTMNKQ